MVGGTQEEDSFAGREVKGFVGPCCCRAGVGVSCVSSGCQNWEIEGLGRPEYCEGSVGCKLLTHGAIITRAPDTGNCEPLIEDGTRERYESSS